MTQPEGNRPRFLGHRLQPRGDFRVNRHESLFFVFGDASRPAAADMNHSQVAVA